MPGLGCEPPKGNGLFPELMKAAFELEIALCPEREPSSTIAINRNAQFRPHTDNGAGAGQSRSLIVGLGTYSGGELMVDRILVHMILVVSVERISLPRTCHPRHVSLLISLSYHQACSNFVPIIQYSNWFDVDAS